MKLYDSTLELRVIKTLTSVSSQKQASKLFSNLRRECFHTKTASESYRRIVALMSKRGDLLDWSELCSDLVLGEESRKKLKAFKKKPFEETQIKTALSLLHKYRRTRAQLEIANNILTQLKRDSIDIEELEGSVSEKLVESRSSSDRGNWFVHIGGNDKSGLKLFKDALTPRDDTYIPTGIKAFDSVNKGLRRGSLMIIASNTSGGKTILAGQLQENMALYGARVASVPLEMDEEENAQRSLSRLTQMSMTKIIDPKSMSAKERQRAFNIAKTFHLRIRRAGGVLTMFTPQEDLTIEEILFALKPFGFDVIFIDYVGLLKGVDGDDQWRALQRVTRFCKTYARIHKIGIVLVAQLTDEGMLASSRGMARDANLMWKWVVDEKARESGIINVEQPKARNQRSFTFPVVMDFERMTVRDLSESENEELQEARESRREGKSKNSESSFGRAARRGNSGNYQAEPKSHSKNKEKGEKSRGDYFTIDD